jgi:nucleotide-binding universal stress UspA family protein
MNGRIVVGVDGSAESVAALRWAAAEARLRSATLHVITAWHVPYFAYTGFPGTMQPPDLAQELERSATELQAVAVKEAIPEEGSPRIEAHVIQGHASSALMHSAQGADMLVVGSRGLGGFGELLLGSVSQQCAHHAPCPVVIVRHDSTSRQPNG